MAFNDCVWDIPDTIKSFLFLYILIQVKFDSG